MNSLTNQNYIVYPTKSPWQQMPCVSVCRAMPCLILQEQVTSLMATVMPHAPLPFLLLSTVYAAWLNMTFLSIRYNQYFTTVKRKGKSHVNLRVTAFLELSLVFSVVWSSSEHVTPPPLPLLLWIRYYSIAGLPKQHAARTHLYICVEKVDVELSSFSKETSEWKQR